MKSYKRTDRVADLIMRELAVMLQQKGDEPCFKEVTVTCVRVTPDFSHAKVYITLFNEENKTQTIKLLNAHAYFFQHLLATTIRLRKIPKLHFVYDESIVRGQKISALIDKAVKDARS